MRTFKVLPGSSLLETEVHSSLHPIHSQTTELKGRIEGDFDEGGKPQLEAPHGGHVEVPVSTIKSGNRLNDMEMQRRANVSRYPSITFDVSDVSAVGDDGRYRGSISVTALGITRTIQGEFALSLDGGRLRLEGEHTFDMRDFGMSPPRIFTLKVEPEVRVKVRLVAEET